MQRDFEFTFRQRSRRQSARRDALYAIFWNAGIAVLVLWVRARYFPQEGAARMVLLILAVLNAAMIIPILIVVKERINEISGGEEDEASQY